MMILPSSLHFAGKTELTNPDLKDVQAGDQVVLTREQSAGRHGPSIRNAELVTIVSIAPHGGEEINGVQVPDVLESTDKYEKRVNNDEVDKVTFRRADGSEETALYGRYDIDTFNFESEKVVNTARFSIQDKGSDGEPLDISYGKRHNVLIPLMKEGFTLSTIPDFVANATDQLNRYDSAYHDLSVKHSGVAELIESMSAFVRKLGGN